MGFTIKNCFKIVVESEKRQGDHTRIHCQSQLAEKGCSKEIKVTEVKDTDI